MRATSGIFKWRADAERASRKLQSTGLNRNRIILLVPEGAGEVRQRVPVSPAEQPGAGKVLGVVAGAAFGLAAGIELIPVIGGATPGVGLTTLGFWCGAILGLLAAAVGGAIGSRIENALTDGLPADELFVYQDALRKGRSVVIAFPYDHDATGAVRGLMTAEGAESTDDARKQWWIGLRSAEKEHYSAPVLAARVAQGKDEVTPISGKELGSAGEYR